ncbi:neurobeachin-like isoform X2 [Liolophura sinensis]|uniref:neurobeachin-like isoform X2 n=1 Tax=Liolophura sinensis TaxID=3198878 RepID=UPI0031598FB5
MEGSTEVKEQEPEKGGVKTVQEIQQCSENDELKFGLLIGLIKVDQVSSKDVLDTVLYLLVGADFDIETNFIIKDSQNILHMLKLLENSPPKLQAQIWSVFTAMLKKSQRNLQACAEVGLVAHVLNILEASDDLVADLLIDLLSVLASYSITVKELKTLVSCLKAKGGMWPRHSVKLLSVLRHMPQRHGPDEFFSFPGKQGSAIALPPIKTWPYQNGWTFSCWLRLDPVTGVNIEREKPFLYSFRTSKGIGYSAHFLGNSLVITSMKVKGKGFQHCVKYDFKPRKWYLLTIVHVYNRWSRSELRCYVDGQIVSQTDMSWLVSASEPYDKCFIGSGTEADEDCMFCGQMSTIYLFSEALSAAQVAAIYTLGPGYKNQFRFHNESLTHIGDGHKRILFDGKLTSTIVFMYNPIACDRQLCLESSPKGNMSHFVHTPHAMMAGDVKAVITHSIHSTLHSLGGVQITFPLFGQLDLPVDKGPDSKSVVDITICADLMCLLCELLESSEAIQQQMLQTRGFLVISYFLEKASKDHITPAVLEAFLDLTQHLVGLASGGPLLKNLFDHILFNPGLWIHSSMEVQTKLYCYLATEFINDAHIYSNIRRVSAVLQTMHTLKYYYWVVNPQNRSGISAKGADGPRPDRDEIIKLRSFMLMYVKELILKGQGILEDELQSILNYLTTLHEDDNLMDVLELTVSLMAEHPSSMVPAFDKKLGVRTVFKLLASPNERLRLQALKLLGFFLMRSTHKRKHESMAPHNSFSLIAERLMLNVSAISMATYNGLFQILTERLTIEILKGKHPEPESFFKFENPGILKVVAVLIRQSQPSPEVTEVKKVFLSDLTILCNNNRENRRTVLQMSVWQEWLFSLAYIYPRNHEEQKITDMVMALFRMLLHHAIKYEFGGWRVWIDTLAILHSKVAYEDFRIHMSKMYNQYERQRVDHISDPEERRQHPVSTISGVGDHEENRPIPRSSVTIRELPEESEDNTEKEVEPGVGVTSQGAESQEGAAREETEQAREEDIKQNINPDVVAFMNEVVEEVVQRVDAKIAEKGSTENPCPEDKTEGTESEVTKNKSKEEAESGAEGGEEGKLNIPLTRSPSQKNQEGRHIFSPGPRAPPFRIPEFRWSYLHQKLLSDLLFAIETDIQVWKSHSTKTVIDFVNAGENHVYVVNVTHMISQLADNLITSCGGLLPLLAAATSPSGDVEILEPTQGLSLEQAVSILQRIMNMTDILVFASSTNFAELEQEKNMPPGGILRQCLRLVCTSAVRNCLECRHRYNCSGENSPVPPSGRKTSQVSDSSEDPIQALINGTQPSSKNIVENLGGQNSPIKDVEKLLQDMDINRLRAVVYRDVEETKQAQFLAVAIVYFCSVLMVSKYRDILEPPTPTGTPTAAPNRRSLQSPSTRNSLDAGKEAVEQPMYQNGEVNGEGDDVEEAQVASNETNHENETSAQLNSSCEEEAELDVQVEVEVHKGTSAETEGAVDGNKVENDESVNKEEKDEEKNETEEGEGVEEKNNSREEAKDAENPLEAEDKVEDLEKETETESEKVEKEEDTAVSEESNKPEDSFQAEVNSEDTTTTTQSVESAVVKESQEATQNEVTDVASAEQVQVSLPTEYVANPVENVSQNNSASRETHQEPSDHPQQPAIASIAISEKPGEQGTTSHKPEKLDLRGHIPGPVENLPLPNEGGSLTERLERALGSVSPLLREIFVDFAPFLSKTLIGSHGQELLIGGLVTLKQSTSVVELVMLLCSQEWQNSLQKYAGLAFIELVNEGRLLAHATRDHIVRVANEAEFILNRMRAEDVQKHAEFETLSAESMVERKDEEKLVNHLITSAKRRDHAIAAKTKEKILNILTNKHGAWGEPVNNKLSYWKLDTWEDDSRRRRRLIKNPLGSAHPEATLKAALEHGATEDAINKARDALHAHLASSKRTQQQATDYTDEELLMDERDLEPEFAGPVAMSTSCKLIVPGLAVAGTMSITKSELYFEMDEEDSQNQKMDPAVLSYVDCLHGKWHFNEIRAIFSRRYLLQNVAIEIFMSNRTAVMFAFADHATVKKVVNALPRVGVGVKYGLPQARRMSLAVGKQLFKLSSMTQKWQRREISNFDYLVYLNTVAGRTYNDLNQYHIFPWVLVNYDSEELDLSQPSNYRDLSKPIGALNPARRAFFEERYTSWEHEQIPPFHYGTHYSTSAFTLNWLIRMEPFTSIFLNFQGGKFDHANRTFFSVSQAWKNSQRDTSDVKELIPEFFYLPEMFKNINGYTMGKTEDGETVDNVVLPPWAKSPEDFIRLSRMALESEFVSCQLHHWIDLIFGYKQRGPEAVRATNVFYYLTYEGSVNLETMTDPVMKEAIENQIRSFGQTPTQLLTEPHPPRSSVMHLSPMMFSGVQDDVCMIMKFLSNSPVTHVSANTHPAVPSPAVTTVTCNHNFAVNRWNPGYQPQTSATSFSSDKQEAPPQLPLAMDQLLALNTGLSKRNLGDNFDQRLKVRHSSFVTTADNRFLFACGFWDKSFRVFSTDSGRICQVVYGHFDVVTCLTRSECNIAQDCYVVTGSKDCTVMVWLWSSRGQAVVGENANVDHPTPKTILTGHETEVTCVAVLAELGLVISGSKAGPCLVHTLNGDLLRALEPPEGTCSPELINLSREAFVIVKFDKGHITNYSINGCLLRDFSHKEVILCSLLSRDGQYLILGCENGVVEVWRTHDLTQLYSYPACDGQICSIALTHDHKFLLAGLSTGCLLVFNIDFNKWHHEYQERYS